MIESLFWFGAPIWFMFHEITFLGPQILITVSPISLESLYSGFGSPFGACFMKNWVPSGTQFWSQWLNGLPFSLKFGFGQFSDN